jgi:hypothetical protein
MLASLSHSLGLRLAWLPALLLLAAGVGAQPRFARPDIGVAGIAMAPDVMPGGFGGGGGGQVSLPHVFSDNAGNAFMIYPMGQFQQQGNMPIYAQGALLQINGNIPQVFNNMGRVDEKTGELVLENMPGPGLSITRRIWLHKEEGWLRYIDIVRNTTDQEIQPTIVYNTHLNMGVGQASVLEDPRRKELQLAWIAQSPAPQGARTCVEMFAGKGAKVGPTIQSQPGMPMVNIVWSPAIAAGKEVALLHLHMLTTTPEAGERWVLGLKESRIMAGIPPEIRRLIQNFRVVDSSIGDREILRGDMLDVVELRGGDQLKGTLKETGFKLATDYGPVELKTDAVIAMLSVGEIRPRQLLVTRDGEVFGGRLERERIALELSSGQLAEIPLGQITRLGYRRRAGEPEEWTLTRPMAMLRAGERIEIVPPEAPLEAVTRYGPLQLGPGVLATVNFMPEEHGVHDLLLTDGSKFAGLVTAAAFDVRLVSAAAQTVKLPTAMLGKLQLAVPPDEPEKTAPVMLLSNKDLLVGSLEGELKLETSFTTLTIYGPEVRRVSRVGNSPAEVQLVLWDETTVTGQLQQPLVAVKLVCGLPLSVPVALIQQYTQPRPRPSKAILEGIKQLVAALGDADFQKREEAQAKLLTMGVVILSTLQDLRPTQNTEAQMRIDQITSTIEKSLEKPRPMSVPPMGTGIDLPFHVPPMIMPMNKD